MLIEDMYIYRLMIHVEEDKMRDRKEFLSKNAKTI